MPGPSSAISMLAMTRCGTPPMAAALVGERSRAQRQRHLAAACSRDGVADDVEHGLDHLVPVQHEHGQAGVVVPLPPDPAAVVDGDETHDMLEHVVNVDLGLVDRAARSQQRVDQAGEAIDLVHDDLRVLGELGVFQSPREELGGATKAAERILDLVGELANDHAPDVVLRAQRIVTRHAHSGRDVGEFDEHPALVVTRVGRNAAVDEDRFAAVGAAAQDELARITARGLTRALKQLAQRIGVVNVTRQRLAAKMLATDFQKVLGGGVELAYPEIPVEQDDARDQVLEDAGVPRAGTVQRRKTVACCT